jgi:glycosyltransferase involved in cell wall biosynthesis
MKIHLHTLTFNEEKILPFFFQHYEGVVDHFFIHDNKSTDNTVKICKSRKNVTVRSWDSKGKMDSFQLTEKRNKIWKESKANSVDFVIVCDADEFLYHPNLKKFLQKMDKQEYSVAKPVGYAMCSKGFPMYDEQKLITDQIQKGIRAPLMDKCVLFAPDWIEKMNFGLGSHFCLPEGYVKVKRDEELKLLHYKTLGLDYSLERKNLFKKRVPIKNFKQGISKHYFADEKQFIDAVEKSIKKAKRVI